MGKLPYAALTRGKGEAGLALAWRNVDFSRGAFASVVLAREKLRASKPGEPLFVTSDSHASATLRSLAEEAARSTVAGYSVSDAVDSLSRKTNPALAGFLFSYLTEHTTINHPENASPLLVKLLGSASVPDIERELVAARIVVDYHRLSQADRMAAVGKLAEVVQMQNAHAAVAALRGLGRIAGFDSAMWTYITPAAFDSVALAYHTLRDKDLVPKTDSLETHLGMRQGTSR